ncbi:MAG: endolytic transglycosylase MltG [Alphaproteobacteria bacterium]|nr:endolytic transglycosylase MltG [Alphaproteobacteria bacterium]
MSKYHNLGIWTVIIGSIVSIFITFSIVYVSLRPSHFDEASDIVIQHPNDSNDSAEIFVSRGISPNLFIGKLIIKIAKMAGHCLKFGEYHLPENVSLWRAICIISSGKRVIHKFCISEGMTVASTIEKLNKNKHLQGSITEIPKEGSLLPATYHFNYPTTRQEIIKKAQSAMQRFIKNAWQKKSKECFLKTPNEVLILASIVELESPGIQLPEIAGMYLLRLSKKMKLQSCPTVFYAIYKGLRKGHNKLSFKDLQYDDPYNTYLHTNLPPAPISNPGKAAIMATLQPKITGALFMYYDMKTMSKPAFAKTFEEHKKNIAKFKK